MKNTPQQYHFLTSLSCEEIAGIVSRKKAFFNWDDEVSGKSYGNQIEIRFDGKWTGTSFFNGTTSKHLDRTKITGSFHTPTSIGCLLLFFRMGCILFLLISVPNVIASEISIIEIFFFMFIPLMMFLSSFVIKKIIMLGHEKNKLKIISFIEENLHAFPFKCPFNSCN